MFYFAAICVTGIVLIAIFQSGVYGTCCELWDNVVQYTIFVSTR